MFFFVFVFVELFSYMKFKLELFLSNDILADHDDHDMHVLRFIGIFNTALMWLIILVQNIIAL